jgi:hypothetical protein
VWQFVNCLELPFGVGQAAPPSCVDPDALAAVQPLVRAAVVAYYATTQSSSSTGSRPSFVAVCPQNGLELVATRAALAWADGDKALPGGADGDAGAVVLLNPKFPLAPRELATFQCAFGLAPFRIQVRCRFTLFFVLCLCLLFSRPAWVFGKSLCLAGQDCGGLAAGWRLCLQTLGRRAQAVRFFHAGCHLFLKMKKSRLASCGFSCQCFCLLLRGLMFPMQV